MANQFLTLGHPILSQARHPASHSAQEQKWQDPRHCRTSARDPPPFDMFLLDIPVKRSTLPQSYALFSVTEKENTLLSLAPGSQVKNVALTGVN